MMMPLFKSIRSSYEQQITEMAKQAIFQYGKTFRIDFRQDFGLPCVYIPNLCENCPVTALFISHDEIRIAFRIYKMEYRITKDGERIKWHSREFVMDTEPFSSLYTNGKETVLETALLNAEINHL